MKAFIQKFWFPLLCSFITAVSLYDTYLIALYADHIPVMEENPMGRWLLNLANGGIGIFVRAKLAGTLLVLMVLVVLWRRNSSKTLPVTSSLAAWQSFLLTYLTFA